MSNKEQMFAMLEAIEQALIQNFKNTDELFVFFKECEVPDFIVELQNTKTTPICDENGKVVDEQIEEEIINYTVSEYMTQFRLVFENDDEFSEDPIAINFMSYIEYMRKLYTKLVERGLMEKFNV